MQKSHSHRKNRTTHFHWHSRKELVEYFKKKYNIEEEMIEREISDATRTFKIRKGKPTDIKELWQKVGTTLERHFSPFFKNNHSQT